MMRQPNFIKKTQALNFHLHTKIPINCISGVSCNTVKKINGHWTCTKVTNNWLKLQCLLINTHTTLILNRMESSCFGSTITWYSIITRFPIASSIYTHFKNGWGLACGDLQHTSGDLWQLVSHCLYILVSCSCLHILARPSLPVL